MSPDLHQKNFAELLARAASRYADREAIRIGSRSVTFRELANRAAGYVAELEKRGVGTGGTCAVLMRTPDDAAAAFFAGLAVGARCVLINELARPRQIEYVLGNASVDVLLTSRADLDTLPRSLEAGAAVLVAEDIASAVDGFAPVDVTPGSCAQVVYTSGSTGQPKGVMMNHSALWAGVRIVSGYLGLRPDDRIASVLPFSFVYGFNQLTTSLHVGATLVVERSALPVDVVDTLRREEVTVLAAVPPLWQQLLAVPAFRNEPIPSLRIVTNAGGRLPPASVRQLREAQPQARLFLMYGLTEVFRSTFLDPDLVDAHPDSIGRAVPEAVVYVVRENGTLCSPGETGELVHGGPTVGMGYLGDPEATDRVFRNNPFASDGSAPPRVVFSGDLVQRDDAGLLHYVGRRDRVFKTLGFRVSPEEVTDVLIASGELVEAAVVTEPDPQRGQRIVACVVLRQGGDLQRLKRFCGVELPRYMQPGRFVVLGSIPRTPAGKQDLMGLQEQIRSDREATGR